MKWQLNRIQYPVYNLGAGKRIGIWTQGCSLGCTGCISQTLWSATGGKAVEVDYLLSQVERIAPAFDGVTVSGGEPFESPAQYNALIHFAEKIKHYTSLTIHVFSGYTLPELDVKYPDRRFRFLIDTLVDGRYEASQHDDGGSRGSINQRVYTFENGEAIETSDPRLVSASSIPVTKKWSVNVSADGDVFMAGIPKPHGLAELTAGFKQAGIEVKFK